ncbi:hypothetical protein FB548_3763 [Pseudoxanthomonas sp. 3HH-4]|nr:hypothetical protein FB548_3763 [Pseudoxanthomonas sp. 3HH-4]
MRGLEDQTAGSYPSTAAVLVVSRAAKHMLFMSPNTGIKPTREAGSA